MSGKGAKGLSGKGAKGTLGGVKGGDKKKPISRSARAGEAGMAPARWCPAASIARPRSQRPREALPARVGGGANRRARALIRILGPPLQASSSPWVVSTVS
jgi:hypothetical protein